jgi:hypothetical protein
MEQVLWLAREEGECEARGAELIEGRERSRESGSEEMCRAAVPARVGEAIETFAEPGQCARDKRAEGQCRVVKVSLALGVGGEEDLESAVEEEAVSVIGTDAPANVVGGVEEETVETARLKLDGGDETGDAGADDDDVAISL